jgi:hypothetical protein
VGERERDGRGGLFYDQQQVTGWCWMDQKRNK